MIALILSAVLVSCASTAGLRCQGAERFSILNSIYFGTARASGMITREEWSDFLQRTVTPRFPQGFTETRVSGQWRGSDGAIVREPSYLLQIVTPPGDLADKAIQEIVAIYKVRFEQEAVLRVKSVACVSY